LDVAIARLILELELEAAEAPHALDARRGEGEHERAADAHERTAQLVDDALHVAAGLLALLPVLERAEGGAAVRPAAEEGPAADAEAARDLGHAFGHLLDLMEHFARRLQARPLGRGDDDDEVALVLLRDESAGHLPVDPAGERGEPEERRER